ncbi:MAG: phosphatidylglycerol lysyltransferase domain-containing protein [Terricaulis sp.]
MDELEPVSTAWLAGQAGAEKAFSLGRFDRAYLARHAIALVRIKGSAIAFANIWTTPAHTHATLDLMRFDPERSPHGVMDFLFTEMLLWAQREGYRDFDLGMTPLAGLAQDEYAGAFARFGRLVYERAGALYGFQGLRQFKEKFGPRWEPRYLAAPGAYSMPVVLAEVALLTSGGVAGLLSRQGAAS